MTNKQRLNLVSAYQKARAAAENARYELMLAEDAARRAMGAHCPENCRCLLCNFFKQ